MDLTAKKSAAFLFSILLAFLPFFCSPGVALAAFDLSVVPSDGGFDLRFTRLSPGDFKQTREVVVRVTSDIGKQYRVVQQVIKPLSLMDGTELAQEQFKMYPLVNSNTQGTLLYREEAPVSSFDTVLYTSNSVGNNDSFRLIYTLSASDMQIPGTYYGRFAYILQPIDSTQSQVVITLNVYADVAAGSVPVVDVSASSVSGRLEMTSEGMTPKDPVGMKEKPKVLINVRAPLGSTYRIYQSLEGSSLMSGAGDEFDLSKVRVRVEGGNKGSVAGEGDLKAAATRQLLYTSDSFGSQDSIAVAYIPEKDFRLQKAGLYRARLNFMVEKTSDAAPQIAKAIDLQVEITPLFDIYVYSGGEEGVALKFGEVSYKTGPRTSDVEVIVESNMGKPYQVVQKVGGPMINETADKLPAEDFTVTVKEVDSQDEPRSYLSESAAVKEGDSVIFASGSRGLSARFIVEYQLMMRADTKAGNYGTRIGYSLSLN